MQKNIAIIGSGNIGSRHLQSLSSIKKKSTFFVIDKNKDMLKIAKERYDQVNTIKRKIYFNDKISNLPENLDLAIIATNSKERKKVLNKLIKNKKVKNLILEKICFQNVKDFHYFEKLFIKKKIKVYVNTPLRTYSVYKKLKKKLSGKDFQMSVCGSQWGLCSNSIHYLDVFCFLKGDNRINLLNQSFLKDLKKGKRSNMYEFSGEIKFENFKKNSLELICLSKKNFFYKVCFKTKYEHYFVDHINETLETKNLRNKKNKKEKIKIEKQSNLTHLQVNQILDYNKCQLTDFKSSFKMQTVLIRFFLKHYKKHLNSNLLNCPIT